MDNSNEKTKYYDKQPKLLETQPSIIKEHMQKGMTAFIVIAAGLIFFFVLLRFTDISKFFEKIASVTLPITYGFVIAFLLNPVMKLLEHNLYKPISNWIDKPHVVKKICKVLGVFGALIFGILVIVALLNLLIPALYQSISGLVVSLPKDIERWISQLNAMGGGDTTVQKIFQAALIQGSEMLEEWVKTDLLAQSNVLLGKVTGGVISVVNTLVDILVGVMTSIYILFSKEKFLSQGKKIVYAFMKPKHANILLHIGRKANEIFSGFIIGKIIDSAIIGVLCFLGMTVLKLPHVLLVSVIVGVTNVIPVFGPYIGAIPGIILIFLANPMQGLYFGLFILALQQLDGNVIGPAILGDSTGLSPFWVIFSIVVGGGLFGVIGMIVGVPTFALIYYVFRMFLKQKLEDKKLPTETEAYSDASYVDDEGQFVAKEKELVKENE